MRGCEPQSEGKYSQLANFWKNRIAVPVQDLEPEPSAVIKRKGRNYPCPQPMQLGSNRLRLFLAVGQQRHFFRPMPSCAADQGEPLPVK